ncbi:hypothetical protein DAI22_01g061100 [Oryza sativa Japonica Group]|nr:hypothetical protein DAI22_01g061100 [Oryza sativa Japonica Group]
MVAQIDSRNWQGPYERGRLLRRAATRFGEGAARSVPLASSDLVLSCPLRRAGASSVSGNRYCALLICFSSVSESETMRVEIMDIPYLHGDDIWAEYRIPNMYRISYLYLGFVS